MSQGDAGAAVKDPTTQLAEALVKAQTAVNEKAVLVDKESKSRAEKRKQIEEELEAAGLDKENTSPFIAYSTEICPHNAPTVADCDFPKFVLKRGKRNQPDKAIKKVVWLTPFEAERIRRFAEIKFMQIPVRDEEGNPVIDKRTEQPKTRAMAYKHFIRLIPTAVDKETGVALDDPSEMLQVQSKKIENLEAELAAFRAGKNLDENAKTPDLDKTLAAENKKLKESKSEATLREIEAAERHDAGPDKAAFRKGGK